VADRPIDVRTVIERSAALIAPMVGSAVTVMVEKAEDVWPVRIDPGQLEQVLMNLTLNARDAMPEGGSLRLSASNQRLLESRRFLGMEIEPGDYVQIQVADTGSGMSEAVLERAFEPFFTTKSTGRGTGLGLAVVYGIVHGNGGHLEVSSLPSVGTELRVYLPRAEPSEDRQGLALVEPSTTPSDTGLPSSWADRGCVVIVEDEQTLRSFLRDQLATAGYTVHAYPDGPHAETGTALLTSPPGLLIVDFVLPGSTGLDVADSFRRRWPALKILFLSAYSATASEQQGYGDISFLTKPFDGRTLSRAVREALTH
jgi:CheY-like chemotaxis protein